MRLATFFAASKVILGVSAGPFVAKRQGETTPASSSDIGLFASTLSNGQVTTIQVIAPQSTKSSSSGPATGTGDASLKATSTEEASKTTLTFSPTGLAPPASTIFPFCHDANAKPFCLPSNESTLYVGNKYFVTWNPGFFPANSTVKVKVLFSNDSSQEVWSSKDTANSWGFVAVETTKEWKSGYDMFNLTFVALNFQGNDPTKNATAHDGPHITIQNAPSKHLPPSNVTKVHKEGLMIGLPIGLGFVLIVVVGLLIGMRKHRTIGLGNIMGRRNRGYGAGKSRRQRLGLGKKGAIRLEDRELQPAGQYGEAPVHSRGDSLGSLVSNDDGEIRPAPGGNQFRDEIQRQKTGR